MAEALMALFTMPWPELSGLQRAGLLLPLTASIAIIYKTIKCPTVREIPLASLVLWLTIVAGMYVVGICLMVTYEILG
jgi:hypothetical protein